MKSVFRPLRRLVTSHVKGTGRQRSVKAVSGFDYDDVKPMDDIPGPKGIYNLPIIGTMLHFKPFTKWTMENIQERYNELLDKHGSLVRINMGETSILVGDPEDIEIVMKHEGKYPERPLPLIHQLFCDQMGAVKGLAHIRGEEWQKFRSPVNPRMMRVKSAQYYLPVQNEVADLLVHRMKTENIKSEDMLDLFFRFACESISVVAFNKRLGYLDPDVEKYPEKLQSLQDIQGLFHNMMMSFNVPPFLLKALPLKMKKDYFSQADRLFSVVNKYYKEAIEEIERRLAEGTLDTDEFNFMYSLMLTDKLSPRQMTAVALDLFGAGTDSTARNLQMMLYNLAKNPDKQEKLYQEIMDVIGPRGPLTMEALAQMPYLLASLRESFRIFYPAMAGTVRIMPTDIVLQGYRINAGTPIYLMNQWTVKNPKYFPDPDKYQPERWLRDETGNRPNPIPSSALLPFGFGPRQCLGKRFAEQEIHLAIIKMIQNFKVSLEPNQDKVEIVYKIFVGTKKPIQFKFENRE